MKSAKDDFSAHNEFMARSAIRDLIKEYRGNRLKIEMKLSAWLEDEFRIRNENIKEAIRRDYP